MRRKLAGLKWTPQWTSRMGCLHGCSEYLGLKNSLAWVFGITGHAFIINMHEVGVCPSGPTAWSTDEHYKLSVGLGLSQKNIAWADSRQEDFEDKLKEAWMSTRLSIDEGDPVYAWEIIVPEYYVINGYDDTGYLFSGPIPQDDNRWKDRGFPWNRYGKTDIGLIEVNRVSKCDSPIDIKAVCAGLRFALQHSNTRDYLWDRYHSGIAGFDTWIETLRNDEAMIHGMTYNTAVWWECRCHAVDFLMEVAERITNLPANTINKTIKAYSDVRDALKQLKDMFPFEISEDTIEDASLIKSGVECLERARDAERVGLQSLEELIATMEKMI